MTWKRERMKGESNDSSFVGDFWDSLWSGKIFDFKHSPRYHHQLRAQWTEQEGNDNSVTLGALGKLRDCKGQMPFGEDGDRNSQSLSTSLDFESPWRCMSE